MPLFKNTVRLLAYSAMLLSLLDFHAADALGQASLPPPQTARFTVTVTDPSGAVIPNADVTFAAEKGLTAKTAQNGSAQVSLPFGSYDITITSPGFKTAKFIQFVLDAARPPSLNVVLQLDSSFGDDFFHTEIVPTVTSDLPNVLLSTSHAPLPMGGRPFSSLDLSSSFPNQCPKDQPKTGAALLDLERHWADALTRKDAAAVACILAVEFEDADVDGSVHSRAEALAKIPQRKPWTNRLTDMRAHMDGNSAFVRGLNEILDADGKVVARVRFTDIFTYRDGRWQALAGQETLVGEAHR